jgi:hypothetical protein
MAYEQSNPPLVEAYIITDPISRYVSKSADATISAAATNAGYEAKFSDARSKHEIKNSAKSALRIRGLPEGLIDAILQSAEFHAVRYWIVDNSGSMGTPDGRLVVAGPDRSFRNVTCSRWEELASSLKWHAAVSAELGVRTEFRCLNPPPGAQQTVVVDGMTDGGKS